APDNGCWTLLACNLGQPPVVRRLAESRFWRQPVSATFHGRDILAPVAAHLSLVADASQLGPLTQEWNQLDVPTPQREAGRLRGEVIFIDHFGNLITNIRGDLAGVCGGTVLVGETEV